METPTPSSKGEKKITVGMKIKISRPLDLYDEDIETHTIKAIEENPYNELVPYSITTCCGKYLPTSGADGRFEGDVRAGGWDLVVENK